MKKLTLISIAFLTSAFLTGCGILYTNIHEPYEYRSATPADVHADKTDPEVNGESCSRSLLYLVAWGDGGYAAATRHALSAYPQSTLYDAKADIKVESYILGLYTKTCTVITGKAAHS
jgi:hypothetical protein